MQTVAPDKHASELLRILLYRSRAWALACGVGAAFAFLVLLAGLIAVGVAAALIARDDPAVA
jgi:hypothetical protein